ncbi:hypothetical protein [Pseudoalteromonas sp. T1lg24]|uniref:hypothetical protein n=1 Tax=Pseudoalteromonas sp. T1lg24 TaxID=2077099 RepID=UPI000CF65BA6|nr:hypothetical protein [Pseudoalteromonas sp. T1lg24]
MEAEKEKAQTISQQDTVKDGYVSEVEFESLSKKVDELKLLLEDQKLNDRLQIVEAKVQTSIDLTDDVVASTSNLIEVTNSKVEQTLTNADLVLSHASYISSTFLFILGGSITVIGLLITWHIGRKQEQHTRETVSKITKKLSKESDFRDEFISSLMQHDELRQNINFAIEQIAKEKIDEANGSADEELINALKNDLTDDVGEDTNSNFLKKIKGIFT